MHLCGPWVSPDPCLLGAAPPPPPALPPQAFGVFQRLGIKVTMISQGASKTNISMVIDGSRGQEAVKALHQEFFENPESEECASPYKK